MNIIILLYIFVIEGKPTQPSNLKVLSVSPYSIKVSWNHGNHPGKLLFTTVTFVDYNSKKEKDDRSYRQESIYTIKNLKPYTLYAISVINCVQGSKSVLCSDPSNTLQVSTDISGNNICLFLC